MPSRAILALLGASPSSAASSVPASPAPLPISGVAPRGAIDAALIAPAPMPPPPAASALLVSATLPSAAKPSFQRRGTKLIAAMMGASTADSTRGASLYGTGASKRAMLPVSVEPKPNAAATATARRAARSNHLLIDEVADGGASATGTLTMASLLGDAHTSPDMDSHAWSFADLLRALFEARRVWLERVNSRASAQTAPELVPWDELVHCIGEQVYASKCAAPARRDLACSVFARVLCAGLCRDEFAWAALGPLPFGNQTSQADVFKWLHMLHYDVALATTNAYASPVGVMATDSNRTLPPASTAAAPLARMVQRNPLASAASGPRRASASDVALTLAHVARSSHSWLGLSPLAFLAPTHELGELEAPAVERGGFALQLPRVAVRHALARAHALGPLAVLCVLDAHRVHTHADATFSAAWQACANVCWWCTHIHGGASGGVADPQRRSQDLAATRRAVMAARAKLASE